MSHIKIGNSGKHSVEFDSDTLLLTKLLITANSGGGKSYLTRVLIELLRPKVQVIVIDVEDEFQSLREKFDFVQIGGEDGAAAMEVRSAGILAERLLEHRISAVCNLFEMKAHLRAAWVKAFVEGLMNAPKKFWRPVLVVLDEAQLFAPENGKAESFNAVVDLATRGRKRGFCLVACVQRLADISKKVTAQLLNRLVGPTFEDVDLDRAVAVMSVARAEEREFREQLKVLEPGHFYALGRAISKTRILFKVRQAQTSHPEPGKISKLEIPELAPEKMKDMLSKLADLPKVAEERVKTEVELRRELRELRTQLTMAQAAAARTPAPAPAAAPAKREPKQTIRLHRMPVKSLNLGSLRRLEAIAAQAEAAAANMDVGAKVVINAIKELKACDESALNTIAKILPKVENELLREGWKRPPAAPAPRMPMQSFPPNTKASDAYKTIGMNPSDVRPLPTKAETPEGLQPVHMRVLNAIADFDAIGLAPVQKKWVAARAGASHKSSSFQNNCSALKSRGLVEYPDGSMIQLTPAGKDIAQVSSISPEDLFESCMKVIQPVQGRILEFLYKNFPNVKGKEEIAAAVGASATSSSFQNNLSALRSAGMIEYVSGGIKCSDWIFMKVA